MTTQDSPSPVDPVSIDSASVETQSNNARPIEPMPNDSSRTDRGSSEPAVETAGGIALSQIVDGLGSITEFANDRESFFGELARCAKKHLEGSSTLLWETKLTSLELIGNIGMDEFDLDEDPVVLKRHWSFVKKARNEKQSFLISADEFFDDDQVRDHRSDLGHFFSTVRQLFVPYVRDGKCEAVMAVMVEEDYRLSATDMIILSQQIELMLQQRRLAKKDEVQTQLKSEIDNYSKLRELQNSANRSLNRKQNAIDIADGLAEFIDNCRVTIGLCYGRSFKIAAVSEHKSVNRRDRVVRCIQKLLKPVAAIQEAVFLPGDEVLFKAGKIKTLNKYFEKAATRSIAFLPVFDGVQSNNQSELLDEEKFKSVKAKKVLAVIAVEGINQCLDRGALEPLWHSAEPIIQNGIHCAHQNNRR